MEEDNVIELRPWFPLSTLYSVGQKQNYMFPSMTKQIVNSPRWTEFDEFMRDVIKTMTNQNSKIENIPTKESKEPQQKKPWTLEKNEMPRNKYDRVRNGPQTFNLYGDAPIITKDGGII